MTELDKLELMSHIDNHMSTLIDELKLNTKINTELLELIKKNNNQTEVIHDYVQVNLSPEQQVKNFAINAGANVIVDVFRHKFIDPILMK